VHAGAAEIAINEQNTVALLGESERVVSAGKTLAFIRESAGKKENAALPSGASSDNTARKLRKLSAMTPPRASSTRRYFAASGGARD